MWVWMSLGGGNRSRGDWWSVCIGFSRSRLLLGLEKIVPCYGRRSSDAKCPSDRRSIVGGSAHLPAAGCLARGLLRLPHGGAARHHGLGVCAVLYLLLGRDWPANIGLAPYGETHIQPPAEASAGNAVSLSFEVLRLAAPSRALEASLSVQSAKLYLAAA